MWRNFCNGILWGFGKFPGSHLEGFGNLEQAGELILRYIDLAAVHVLKDGLHVHVADVLEHDNRVRAGHLEEQRLEVGGARGQYHLVALDGRALACQGAVGESLALKQLVEYGQQIGAVVVPAQAVLLRSAPHLASTAFFTKQANLQTKPYAKLVFCQWELDHRCERLSGSNFGSRRLPNFSPMATGIMDFFIQCSVTSILLFVS